MRTIYRVHLALLLVTFIFSLNYVIAKFLTPQYILPFAVIVLRVWFSTALFWMFHQLTIRERIRERKDYLKLAFCALFGVIANQLLFFKGLTLTTPINMSIIMTTSPILVLVASAIVLKEKITLKKMLGIVFGATGAFLLIGGTGFSFQSETVLGDFLILMNASSYGIYLVLVKPLMRKYHSLTVIKWVFTFGCIGVLPFGFGELMVVDWERLPDFAIAILIFIIVGVTFLNYLLNAWGLAYVHASVVAFYIYLQPVMTSIIAISLGQDQLSWEKVFFSILILIGIVLVSVEK